MEELKFKVVAKKSSKTKLKIYDRVIYHIKLRKSNSLSNVEHFDSHVSGSLPLIT